MIEALCANPTLNILFCEPLSYPFMQRAVLVMLILGVVAGVIGAFVVVRGMAFLADALGHAIMPGVAIAYVTGGANGPLLLGAMVAGAITAVVIGFFTRGGKLREDSVIGIVFTGALALGLTILSLNKATAVDLEELLVGNVLAISPPDLLIITGVAAIILLLILAFYKELVITSFDPILGATLRLPTEVLRYLLLLLLAMTAVISLQAVGIILIAAMLVTPATTAYLLVRRLHLMMLLGAVICCLSGLTGIFLAWHFSMSPSAAIVLTMTLIFVVVYLFAPERGLLWSRWRQNTKVLEADDNGLHLH
jgi:ABC-type Mn2+/Zn2+ transport system permease subunit